MRLGTVPLNSGGESTSLSAAKQRPCVKSKRLSRVSERIGEDTPCAFSTPFRPAHEKMQNCVSRILYLPLWLTENLR